MNTLLWPPFASGEVLQEMGLQFGWGYSSGEGYGRGEG